MTSGPRPVHAPHGSQLSCKGWPQEAAMRMLMNNLDPDIAEHPDQLIVYGGEEGGPQLGRLRRHRGEPARSGA